ncbi:MAG: hypothetical protein IKS31_00950 [Clostridia bacterium]|nr:hypothetical protein [Clostridia bacterium]
MAIIATGSKTIIDLSDGKSLSVYLGANQPRTQIHDVNANSYSPNWTTTAGKLIVTPVVYANQTAIALNNTALTITWKRKEGSGSESALASGETVSGNVLTVNQNKLSSITSGQLTYIAYVAYADPDTGLTINATADINFSLLTTGEDAKSAWISGEQVFKYNAAGTVAPAQITLTANLQNVTMGKWQYKNSSGSWADYPTTSDNANITGTTLIVKPTHSIWNGQTATLRITTSDASIGDTTSIYKVQDGAPGGTGAPGDDASIVFLTNENMTFAGTKDGKVAATTKTCNVVAYTGTSKVTPVLGTISGAPTGMTVTAGTASNNEIPLTITIAANATLGAAGQLNGTVNVPVTSPVATTLQIQWSKVNTGATGTAASVLTVYAPGGTVFTNGLANDTDSITLNAQYFQGSTDLTANSNSKYLWEKYASGSWTTVQAEAAGASGNTLTVQASSVQGSATYRCRARSGTSTVYLYDTITIIDKTDNYQADIDSTAGDIFKNTVGTTCLICRLWQNGAEVDPLKSTTYSATAPSSPATGTFYYKIASNSPTTALMRYSGSAWVDVTSNADYKHEKTYTWYRRDKDGNPMDNGDPFATGKVIYVDGDDVTVKTVFVCEVS